MEPQRMDGAVIMRSGRQRLFGRIFDQVAVEPRQRKSHDWKKVNTPFVTRLMVEPLLVKCQIRFSAKQEVESKIVLESGYIIHVIDVEFRKPEPNKLTKIIYCGYQSQVGGQAPTGLVGSSPQTSQIC